MNNAPDQKPLLEVAKVFLKLGCVGFGGPAVHIAMMEEEVVLKRQWFTHGYFLDLVGATNLIPGPNSTEMTMHCGYERAGWAGLIVAGLCFILPAVIITGAIAYLYDIYGHLPEVQRFIYGVKPAALSVIAGLMISLGRRAVKSVELGIIGLAAAALVLYGTNEIWILFGGGLVGVMIYVMREQRSSIRQSLPLLAIRNTALNWKVFWLFLKVGSVLYGSGYVLFAFLDAELVQRGLLSKSELVDAIAVGQFTPGPVFSSATFIGWQIAGLPGAIAATVGIFLPSFLFVALLNPLIPRLRKSKVMAAFLDTVNVVSVAIILAVCVDMGKSSIIDWRTILIAALGFIITIGFKKLNSAFVILGGAALGYGLSLI